MGRVHGHYPYPFHRNAGGLREERTSGAKAGGLFRVCDGTAEAVPFPDLCFVNRSCRATCDVSGIPPDAVTFRAGYPALETPGYFRVSFRDRGGSPSRQRQWLAQAHGGFRVACGFEEVPGFFVGFVFLGVAAGGEEEVAAEADDDYGGEDVPDVFEDDVDGEEVDLVAGVILAAAGFDGDDVSAVGAGDGGLDLDAEEVAVAFDGAVVAGGVSPGFGDVEAALGDASHEDEFGPFAAMFGVLDDDAAAAVEWEDLFGGAVCGAVVASRFLGACILALRFLASRFPVARFLVTRFLVTHFLVTHGFGPKHKRRKPGGCAFGSLRKF